MGRFEEENLKLRKKLTELRKKTKREIDEELEQIYSFAALGGGSIFIIGIVLGRITQ